MKAWHQDGDEAEDSWARLTDMTHTDQQEWNVGSEASPERLGQQYQEVSKPGTEDSPTLLCRLGPITLPTCPAPPHLASIGCIEENSVGAPRREVRVERAPETEVGHRDIDRPPGQLTVSQWAVHARLGEEWMALLSPGQLEEQRHCCFMMQGNTKAGISELLIYGLSLRLREGRRALSYQGLPGIQQIPGEGGSR